MASPLASARPARPPKADCRSVARDPRAAGTSIPPCRATYARQPDCRPVKRSTLPGRARTLAPVRDGPRAQLGPLEHGAQVGPGHREAQRREKGEGRPRHRALERRGARRVADRAVGHGVGARVHGPRAAHPDPAVTRSAGVLHRRQQAGLEHLDDRRGRGTRDRRRGLGRRQLGHRVEAHAVAGGEESRLRAGRGRRGAARSARRAASRRERRRGRCPSAAPRRPPIPPGRGHGAWRGARTRGPPAAARGRRTRA